jgi:hypothetical protein
LRARPSAPRMPFGARISTRFRPPRHG